MRTAVRISVCILVVAVMGSIFGCASTKYTYEEDVTETSAGNIYFNHKDLQILSQSMIDDLVSTGLLDDKPRVRVSRVKNKTDEHIDTKGITDSIRTKLIRSQKVIFVTDVSEEDVRGDVLDEQKFGESNLADPSTAPEIGKMKAAEYHLFGELMSMQTEAGRTKERYFKFTLSMVNVETGVLEWANEKAILKKGKKLFLGL